MTCSWWFTLDSSSSTAAVTDGLRLKDDVPLTATVDIGDRVTGVQCFDGHQIRISV